MPVTDEYHGTRFFLRRAGRTVATPLFAVLVAVETTDVLAGMMDRFVYLKFGLAAILVFVGIKMLIADVWHVPIALSLSVIAVVLAVSVVCSLRETAEREEVVL